MQGKTDIDIKRFRTNILKSPDQRGISFKLNLCEIVSHMHMFCADKYPSVKAREINKC